MNTHFFGTGQNNTFTQALKSSKSSSSLVLFLALLLLQVKQTLLFLFTLPFACGFSFPLAFFPLKLQRLLRPCPDSGSVGLLPCFTLPPFRVCCFPFDFRLDWRTEAELTVIFDDKIPNLAVLWFCAECDLANGQTFVFNPFKHTDPKRLLKKHGERSNTFVHKRNPPEKNYRNGQPGGAGYLPEQRFRRPGYLPALARLSAHCVFILLYKRIPALYTIL